MARGDPEARAQGTEERGAVRGVGAQPREVDLVRAEIPGPAKKRRPGAEPAFIALTVRELLGSILRAVAIA